MEDSSQSANSLLSEDEEHALKKLFKEFSQANENELNRAEFFRMVTGSDAGDNQKAKELFLAMKLSQFPIGLQEFIEGYQHVLCKERGNMEDTFEVDVLKVETRPTVEELLNRIETLKGENIELARRIDHLQSSNPQKIVPKKPKNQWDKSKSKLISKIKYPNGTQIHIRQGDIAQEDVDCIVNAANSYLLHGAGVAGAITHRGGQTIQKESNLYVSRYGSVEDGGIAVTGAGLLMAEKVIHAVAPIWRKGNFGEAELLGSCISKVLDSAKEMGMRSISIPAIGSGIFGVPKNLVAKIMMETTDKWVMSEGYVLDEIRFTNYDTETATIFAKVLKEYHS